MNHARSSGSYLEIIRSNKFLTCRSFGGPLHCEQGCHQIQKHLLDRLGLASDWSVNIRFSLEIVTHIEKVVQSIIGQTMGPASIRSKSFKPFCFMFTVDIIVG